MHSDMTPSTAAQRQFPCKQCGANLVFEPGQASLVCPYCQTVNQIMLTAAPIVELDFYSALSDPSAASQMQETLTVKCVTCGAESSLSPNVTSDRCPFCGSAIVTRGEAHKQIMPRS